MERIGIDRGGRGEDAESDPYVLQGRRVHDVVHAVHHADAAPHEEDADGADERPHEPLAPVPVVVLGVRRLGGRVYADVEQALVDDVRHGVHRLGEHGRRAGDRVRARLAQEDGGVGVHGDVHRVKRAFVVGDVHGAALEPPVEVFPGGVVGAVRPARGV